MGLNLKRVEFESDATWTCPPGVTRVRVSAAGSQGRQLTVGSTSAAIDNAGAMWGWGNGFVGQVGNGTANGYSSPVLVSGGKTWRQISLKDGGQAVAIDTAGAAFAWGGNPSGELGDGTVVNKSVPTAVLGGFKWKQVVAPSSYSMGITNTGDLYAWGRNYSNTLGFGAAVSYSSPVLIAGGLKWRRITGALLHWAGITTDGSLYTCGVNADGQLGDGTVVNKSIPLLVPGGYKWRAVSAAVGAKGGTAAITDAGDMFVWGDGSKGQSGNNDRITRSTPTLVTGGKKWSQVGHQGNAVFGLTTDGDIYAWGDNFNGSLGISVLTAVSTPTLVVGGLKFREITESNGFVHMAGITVDGNLYAWGYNAQGDLADGTLIDRSSPTLVIGAKSWRAQSNVLENELIIGVVPGQAYQVSLNGDYSAFGNTQLTPPTSAFGLHKITLEYFG